jgi:hypothetical protein
VLAHFCLRIGDPCPWRSINENTIISGDTSSEVAAAQITRWLQTCSESHRRCRDTFAPQSLPTRVVEILGPKSARLKVTSEDERGLYTTLSHAWGNGNTIKTQASNLPSYKENIPWNGLPKTFREAIQVTLRLGLRYIWIDSLCIIQDDDVDWRNEGSRMASVYSQSYLTIAATKSSNSRGGCFAVSSPQYIGHTYELKDSHGDGYTIHVRHQLEHRQTTEFPLLGRGWVFQERLLSPRILHFGPEELLWECMSCYTCECGNWNDHYILRKSEVSYRRKPPSPTARWHEIVDEYSGKLLTFDTDVFPALQGIAKQSQEQRQCAYYAGLWEDSLPKDLLWYRPSPGIETRKWRAPSWSWASGIGNVTWGDMDDKFTSYFSVVKISTEPVGADSLGELKGGSVTLTGPCVLTTIRDRDDGSGPSYTLRAQEPRKERGGDPSFRFYPDFANTRIPSTDAPLTLMKAARSQAWWDDDGQHDFLVFKCVDSTQDIYERVGLASLYGKFDWTKRRRFLHEFDRAAMERTLTVI